MMPVLLYENKLANLRSISEENKELARRVLVRLEYEKC